MAQLRHAVVTAFKGMDHGPEPTGAVTGIFPTRRRLDTPSLLRNMLVTSRGHLWYPPEGDVELEDLETAGNVDDILKIANFSGPRDTMLVQVDDEIQLFDANFAFSGSPDHTITLASNQKVWVVTLDDVVYLGNEAETWKVTYSAGYVSTNSFGTDVPSGYHGMVYRGRLFIIERPREIHFSQLNDAEDFSSPGGSFFLDDQGAEGDEWSHSAGSAVALWPYGEFLAILMTQGVYLFSGADVDTEFSVRRTRATHGLWARDSVETLDGGLLYFGGTPRGEFSFYEFNGAASREVGADIAGIFREWSTYAASPGFFEVLRWEGIRWQDLYLLSAIDPHIDYQIYALNLRNGSWSVWGGWTSPTVGLARLFEHPDRLVIGETDGSIRSSSLQMFRAPGEDGQVTLGFHDEDRPHLLRRYLGLKLAGVRTGTAPTVTMTATTSEGDTATTTVTITTDIFDGHLLPINLRGTAIEIDLAITPGAADSELLIQTVELLYTTKGEKVSRA